MYYGQCAGKKLPVSNCYSVNFVQRCLIIIQNPHSENSLEFVLCNYSLFFFCDFCLLTWHMLVLVQIFRPLNVLFLDLSKKSLCVEKNNYIWSRSKQSGV